MSGALEKIAPVAVVLAVVLWCCWPHLGDGDSQQLVQQESEPLRITDSMLSPEIRSTTKRDPFTPIETKTNVAAVAAAFARGLPVAEPNHRQPEVDIANRLRGVTLNATFIQGNRRVALIQGQLYQQGQQLAVSGSTSSCVVSKILADRVLIQHGGKTVELKYPSIHDLQGE